MTYEKPTDLYAGDTDNLDEMGMAYLAALDKVHERLSALRAKLPASSAWLDAELALQVVDQLARELREDYDEDGEGGEPISQAELVHLFETQDGMMRAIEDGADPVDVIPPADQPAPALIPHPYRHEPELGVADRCSAPSETIPSSLCWKTESEHEPAPVHLLVVKDGNPLTLASEVCRAAYPLTPPPAGQTTRFLACVTCPACRRVALEGLLS